MQPSLKGLLHAQVQYGVRTMLYDKKHVQNCTVSQPQTNLRGAVGMLVRADAYCEDGPGSRRSWARFSLPSLCPPTSNWYYMQSWKKVRRGENLDTLSLDSVAQDRPSSRFWYGIQIYLRHDFLEEQYRFSSHIVIYIS